MAIAVVASGLFIVFLGIVQAQRIEGRNQEMSVALTLLNTQIDADSRADYPSFSNTNPAIQSLNGLPNPTLTRSVTENAALQVKSVTYSLAWFGVNGANSLQADFQLTPNGLNNVSILPPPTLTITQINPTSGPTTGGTSVMITGSGFAASITAKFDGISATQVSRIDSRTLIAVTPPHIEATVDVQVANSPSETATLPQAFTYVSTPPANPAPTITSINPNSGPTSGGTAVTITGTHFLANPRVRLGGLLAYNIIRVSDTTITATTPAHAAGAVDVMVLNTDNQSALLPNGYTYIAPPAGPTITGINPNSGPTSGGTVVTITGTNFETGAFVAFGDNTTNYGATNIVVNSSTSITATTPPHAAGPVTVFVNNPSPTPRASLVDGYTYIEPAVCTPTITRKSTTLPIARYDAASVWKSSTNRILLIGGFSADQAIGPIEDVDEYNPATSSFSPAGAVFYPYGLYGHSAAWSGRLIIVGGKNDNTINYGIIGPNPDWDPYRPFPDGNSRMGTASITNPANGKVYIFGGENASSSGVKYNTIIEYIPSTNQAVVKNAHLPQAMSDMAAVWSTANNKIYIFGGSGTNSTNGNKGILEYDPANDTISSKGNDFDSLFYIDGIAVWDPIHNKAFIMTGQTSGGQTSKVWQYDPLTNSVTQVLDLLTGHQSDPKPWLRVGSTAVWSITNNKAYIFGGRNLSAPAGNTQAQQLNDILEFSPC